MTDLFLSYKAEDRARVAPLVEALEADGYSVWWDADIAGGDDWRETICRYLDAARCVIVVWSKRSVGRGGHFVRDEATRALRRGVYLPVKIDKVEPPLGFGETQALNLQGWNGNRDRAEYRAVLAAVRSRLGEQGQATGTADRTKGFDRRLIIGGGAAVAVTAAVGGWLLIGPRNAKQGSIAVLPFANLSGDPGQDYFSDGIAEELRSALARIAGLKVVGRISSEAVRGEDAKEAARKLSVANILTGSVRRSPRVIRVNAQLLDGRSGVERWSEVYDRTPGDAIDIQTDIATNVAQALSFSLDATGLRAGGTRNPAAQDLYLKAIATRRGGMQEELLRQSISLFDAAIAVDPGFGDAYAQKSIALTDLTGVFSENSRAFEEGFADAIETARHATTLAPDSAVAHAALAEALAGLLQLREADAEYRKAAATGTSDPMVVAGYAGFLGQTGRTAESLAFAERGVALDPLNPRVYAIRANLYFLTERYRETISTFQRVIGLVKVPPYLAWVRIAECHMFLGDIAKAREFLNRAPPDFAARLAVEAILEARTGDIVKSTAILTRLRQVAADSAVYQEAQVLAQQKKSDEAFATLDRALRIRDPGLIAITTDPYLEPLRTERRFLALRTKLGFPL